jgi:hypothetical protein
MARKTEERPPATPTLWVPGDPGYEPVDDPPEDFFHVVCVPRATPEGMENIVHLYFAEGRDLGPIAGRRYLVNAADEADARAQVERIERQTAENDPLHQHQYGEEPWEVRLVAPADPLRDARRDPDPAQLEETLSVDPDRAAQRKARAQAVEA